jgi:hypothetical protein
MLSLNNHTFNTYKARSFDLFMNLGGVLSTSELLFIPKYAATQLWRLSLVEASLLILS